MSRFKYPVDTDQFQRIREDGKVYVDKTKNDIYVLELKVDDSVDNALAQIDSKGYAIPYEADGRTITKCGVTISSEARNIVHWRAVDNDGKVINEQKF